MIKEFRNFIVRGNVLDLAVAVIIGGAFGKIITSLVTDIIMPLIGLLIGGIDFSGLAFTVGKATMTYGNFINNVINFLVIALVIFLLIKTADSFKKPAPAPEVVTKECPHCFSIISIKATRCPNCTSELK
jgi:large conductance mechanosensitive channel